MDEYKRLIEISMANDLAGRDDDPETEDGFCRLGMQMDLTDMQEATRFRYELMAKWPAEDRYKQAVSVLEGIESAKLEIMAGSATRGPETRRRVDEMFAKAVAFRVRQRDEAMAEMKTDAEGHQ
jgi:hypothetical protein